MQHPKVPAGQSDRIQQPPSGGQSHPSTPKFQPCQEEPTLLLTINRAEVIVEVGCAGCSPALHEEVPIGVWVAGHQRHLVVVVSRVGSRWWRRQPEEASFLQVLMSHCWSRRRGEKHGEKVPSAVLDLGAAVGPVSPRAPRQPRPHGSV